MDIIDRLAEIFKEFPGIGERQAKRFVYFLMARNSAYSENLVELIKDLKKETAQCKECFRFFIVSKNERVCDICANANTDSSVLMIVEKDSDLESIRKSRVYHGKYFVLGGLVPIVEKTTKSRVRILELQEKIKREKELKEIILAFSISPQGDHTDTYVRQQLKDICDKSSIKISSLGKGLSTGTELEYSDNDTLKNALKNRQ
ncbi:MAG: Recombination protein RecR [Candidatus Nomurabacteria bacterium GW2011_GWB1_40_7]|uniref:Recombination protein RecR n=1 Tax=Candidatus Nomurabacteria bacterium GW2011_GWB1_40_7 TaxID=1618744 RepID=A0A0G0VFG1_9BACT|nr:MAG: Recombination protein RecR [Candidatus Nomurabacteria bacterium GW2011_GWB1_40_7]